MLILAKELKMEAQKELSRTSSIRARIMSMGPTNMMLLCISILAACHTAIQNSHMRYFLNRVFCFMNRVSGMPNYGM